MRYKGEYYGNLLFYSPDSGRNTDKGLDMRSIYDTTGGGIRPAVRSLTS